MKIKTILYAVLTFLPCTQAYSQNCFESENIEPPIRFSWEFPGEHQKYGRVRYEKGSQDILVKSIVWQEAKDNNNSYLASIGRPFEFESVWQEQVGKNKLGLYRLTTQGARIYSMTYQKTPHSSVISFKETNGGCALNKSPKETDRLASMATELRKVGATVEEGDDYIVVTPPEVWQHATIDTYDDHRMAMCFSLVALSEVGVTINEPKCVGKTFPTYFEVLNGLLK
jgi:hypothetical protein